MATFSVNNTYELEFLHEAVRLANATHNSFDEQAHRCINAKVHTIGVALEIRARMILGLPIQNLPDVSKLMKGLS